MLLWGQACEWSLGHAVLNNSGDIIAAAPLPQGRCHTARMGGGLAIGECTEIAVALRAPPHSPGVWQPWPELMETMLHEVRTLCMLRALCALCALADW